MAVSPGGYYAWRKRLTEPPRLRHRRMADLIRQSFWANRRRYGSRRISLELKKQGIRVGRGAVRAVLKAENLRAIAPKKFVPKTTDSKHGQLASPNLLKLPENKPHARASVIIGDITYLRLVSGEWCYLAVWQDKFTRRIIGWAVAAQMTAELVNSALRKGIAKGLIKANAIIHTDHGSQYVAGEFRALLARHKFRQSMSGKGNCYDNAQAESFFSRFKAELVEDGTFSSVEEARSEIFGYIEGYYNTKRIHTGLGDKTPLEFEIELKIKEREKKSSLVSTFT
jgi:transposase InsO family protein